METTASPVSCDSGETAASAGTDHTDAKETTECAASTDKDVPTDAAAFATPEAAEEAMIDACRRGRFDDAKRILRHVEMAFESYKCGRSLLHVAAERGCVDVVELLRYQGVRINQRDEDGRTPLIDAASRGQKNPVIWLLSYGARVDAADNIGRTVLHCAAENGHMNIVELLLHQGASVDAVDTAGRTALHCAAFFGWVKVVELLLSREASVGAVDREGRTALHYATLFGWVNVAALLLSRGASYEATDIDGQTALHYAIGNDDVNIVGLLLFRATSVNATDRNGRTALHFAAEKGRVSVVELLLSREASVDATDRNGRTALHYASENGHVNVVEQLVFRGASAETRDSSGRRAIHFASEKGHFNIVEFLLFRGATVDAVDNVGWTALNYSVAGHRVNIVKLLLSSGASVDVTDKGGRSPLHHVARKGNVVILDLLLSRMASIDATDNNGQTPLHFAVEMNEMNVVELLLTRGASIGATDREGQTALHYAVRAMLTIDMELLLSRGLSVDATDREGQTALHYAARQNKVNDVKQLLSRGASVDVTDNSGQTALHYAAKKGHMDVVALLLSGGASIEATDRSGQTALHFAILFGWVNVVGLLLSRGASTETRDIDGQRALHWATRWVYVNIVELLLFRGASIDATDNNGQTALDYASQNGHVNIVELLLLRGASIDATDNNGQTALHRAVETDKVDVVELLLFRGASVEATDNRGRTALFYARGLCNVNVAKLLLSSGASVEATDNNGQTPLHFAVEMNEMNVVELLLTRGASIGATDREGQTALHYAVRAMLTIDMELLLSRGLSVDATDREGQTALHYAARQNKVNDVKQLLSRGASVDVTDNSGQTALHYAAKKGHMDVVALLLSGGASIDVTDKHRRTALHYAAGCGDVNVVKLLLLRVASVDVADLCIPSSPHDSLGWCSATRSSRLEEREVSTKPTDKSREAKVGDEDAEGQLKDMEVLMRRRASVLIPDRDGVTPLHAAARLGNIEIVKTLIGLFTDAASWDIADHNGDTPTLTAARAGQFETVRLLVQTGASAHVRSADGETLMLSAARFGDSSVVYWLSELRCLVYRVGASDNNEKEEETSSMASRSSRSATPPVSLLSLTLQTLCEYASRVYEFEALWSRVAERLTSVYVRMSRSPVSQQSTSPNSQQSTSHENILQLAMIAFHFAQLKATCSSRSVFARLVACTDVAMEIRDIHMELTFLEQRLPAVDLCVVASGQNEWKSECASDERTMLEVFRSKIETSDPSGWIVSEDDGLYGSNASSSTGHDNGDTTNLTTKSRDEDEAKLLSEAASLLQRHVLQSDKWSQELSELLTLSLRKVQESGRVKTAQAVPDWFIPFHEFYISIDELKPQWSRKVRPAVRVVRGRWAGSRLMCSTIDHERFVKVMDAWSKLNHPNVVKVYGASHHGSSDVAALESAMSTNISEYIKREGRKGEVYQKLFEVALGLQYLLDRSIFVGYLEYGDVWVGSDGVAKICLLHSHPCARRRLPYDYHAPELGRDESSTPASSVYAFGEFARSLDWQVKMPQIGDLIVRMSSERPEDRPTIASVVLELKKLAQTKTRSSMNTHTVTSRGDVQSSAWLESTRYTDFLLTIPEWIERLEMKCGNCNESRDAVNHIFKRMRDVLRVIREQRRQQDDVAVVNYIRLLEHFDRFLRVAVSEKSILMRRKSQKVSLKSHVFHRRLDELIDLLKPATVDRIHEWQNHPTSRSSSRDSQLSSVREVDEEEKAAQSETSSSRSESDPSDASDASTARNDNQAHMSNIEDRETGATTATHEDQRGRERPVRITRFGSDQTASGLYSLDGTTSAIGAPSGRAAVTALSDHNAIENADSTPDWLIRIHELDYNPDVDKIGVGAFGDVYKARWNHTPVVVKFMGYEEDADAYDHELFDHELRVWFPLNHRNVLKLFGASRIGKRYFVCEHAGNGNLLEYVKKSDANAARRWQLLHQVGRGLQYLHEQSVVHNDLKCDNVLIDANDDAKIIDFGLSSMMNRAEVSVDPKRHGAVHWRSPEYLRGERLTTASDVYSFGMLIIELVTGEAPWGRNSSGAVVRMRVVKQGKLPLRPASMSDTEWHLICMMCASEPTQRVGMSFVVKKLNQLSQQYALEQTSGAGAR